MKKIAILLLILILFSACGNKTNAPDETKADDTTAAEVTTIPSEKPIFTDNNYNGRKFTILYPIQGLLDFAFVEDLNGEVMNDAAYERLQTINEELGIEIDWYQPGIITTILPVLRKTVQSGLPDYDLLITHCAQDIITNISDSLILNWNDIPNTDMEKSYWHKSMRDTFEINGMLGYVSNDFLLKNVCSIFFNKQLQENLQLGNFYDLVSESKWTWDKLTELSIKGSMDINGDGIFDEEDQYGFVSEFSWMMGGFPISADIYMVKTDGDGIPQIIVDSERTIQLFEKLYYLLRSNNASYGWDYKIEYDPNVGGVPPIDFAAGKALFYNVILSLAPTFRSMEIDFGILPFPKWDEKQENYLTLNWSGFLAVPMTASDPDLTGKVVELLGYYSQQNFVPVYYDILLGQKISRDNDSMEMLDIIFNNTVYDLGIVSGIHPVTYILMNGKGDNFISYMDSNMNSWQKQLDNYIKACTEYIELHG